MLTTVSLDHQARLETDKIHDIKVRWRPDVWICTRPSDALSGGTRAIVRHQWNFAL